MDVRNDILLYEDNDIESFALIPKKLERNRFTVKLEKIAKRAIDILAGLCGMFLLIPLTIGL